MFSRKQDLDEGPFAPIPCSVCQKRKLHLHHELAGGLIALVMSKQFWYIKCEACGYRLDIEPSEEAACQQVAQRAKLVLAGELDSDIFLDEVVELNLEVIRKLLIVNIEHPCTKCAEMVPATMPACWNCGSENENQFDKNVASDPATLLKNTLRQGLGDDFLTPGLPRV